MLGLVVTDLLQELYPYLRVGPSTVGQCGRARVRKRRRSYIFFVCGSWILTPKLLSPPF